MKHFFSYAGLIIIAFTVSAFLLKQPLRRSMQKPSISADYGEIKKGIKTTPFNTAKYTKKAAKGYRYVYKSGSKFKSKYNKKSRAFFTVESNHYLMPNISTFNNKRSVSMPKGWNEYHSLPATDLVYAVYQRNDIDKLLTAVVDTLVKLDNEVLNYVQESNQDIQNGFTEALKTQLELYLDKRKEEWETDFRAQLKAELKSEILAELQAGSN